MEAFTINVSDAVLEDLAARIRQARWLTDPRPDWDYGTDQKYLQELAAYWLNEFDWRKQEQRLNSFRQFTTDIDDCRVHFVYERGKGRNPLPIVISHGWPSSFAEMLRILPMLTDPASHGGNEDDAFDVVVPSLPGYIFSSPRRDGHMRAHDLWVKLMRDVLGYERFLAQGTDVGAGVTSLLGYWHPAEVMGIHISSVDLLPPEPLPKDEDLSDVERTYLAKCRQWDSEENGYGHQQGTRPQSLAFGLNDSPVGLAAWIVEKFRAWSDCHGDLESRFSKDELLTTITLYWVTGTIGSSMRHYYHGRNKVNVPPPREPGGKIRVPTGIAMFPGEVLLVVPREFAERSYNIQHWTNMPEGGHFAAIETPELLVEDIRTFARSFRK